jgi:hypothetical protein
MRVLKYLGSFVVASAMLSAVSSTPAQVSVNIGVAPVCPYGYFPYAPYDCAPYGYYGTDWFTGGVFIGAGPWFHGNHGFYGHVDQRYDPRHGYHGPTPERGEQPFNGFRANAAHDEHGNPGTPPHDVAASKGPLRRAFFIGPSSLNFSPHSYTACRRFILRGVPGRQSFQPCW